ncbi:MAG: hypothetical protein QME51_11500, partial [Planctomycetota bacterium]|nr:hypothetical protein [Planctomycetota bacterium]
MKNITKNNVAGLSITGAVVVLLALVIGIVIGLLIGLVISQQTKKQEIAEYRAIIKTALEEQERTKKEWEKAQKAMKIRAEAKAILDRTSGSAPPDDKIRSASEALKIDPTYGEAYQVIG